METLEAANKTKLITDAFKYVKTFPAVLARFKKFLEKRDTKAGTILCAI